MARSLALPVTSCQTAMDELIPRPSLKSDRTVRPEPLGATRMTSTSTGGMTPVSLWNTTEKPWEK